MGGGTGGFGGIELVPAGVGDEGGAAVDERDESEVVQVRKGGGEHSDAGYSGEVGGEGDADEALGRDAVLHGEEAVGGRSEAVKAEQRGVGWRGEGAHDRGGVGEVDGEEAVGVVGDEERAVSGKGGGEGGDT